MANSREERDRAEAKFRKTLKATWAGKTSGGKTSGGKAGKQATSLYEAEARLARDKTARLKLLRLARAAAEIKTEVVETPVIPRAKRAPPLIK